MEKKNNKKFYWLSWLHRFSARLREKKSGGMGPQAGHNNGVSWWHVTCEKSQYGSKLTQQCQLHSHIDSLLTLATISYWGRRNPEWMLRHESQKRKIVLFPRLKSYTLSLHDIETRVSSRHFDTAFNTSISLNNTFVTIPAATVEYSFM